MITLPAAALNAVLAELTADVVTNDIGFGAAEVGRIAAVLTRVRASLSHLATFVIADRVG